MRVVCFFYNQLLHLVVSLYFSSLKLFLSKLINLSIINRYLSLLIIAIINYRLFQTAFYIILKILESTFVCDYY